MTGEQAAFGLRLRRERERREVTLASVAESIKIKQSLLASLERGDASQWPPGIYRRAFLREYAVAVGLPAESILAEFLRLFPESGVPVPNCIDPSTAGRDLRLTLARERRWSAQSLARQAIAALLDGCAVFAIGAGIGMLIHVGIWTAIGTLAVIYYSVATVCFGRSPALWVMNAALLRRANRPKARVRTRPNSRDLLHIASANPRPEGWTPSYERSAQPFVENARSASR